MKIYKLKNKFRESESNEILVYLKNNKTGEEATINLLDYKGGYALIDGCINALKLTEKDLEEDYEEVFSNIYLTHLSDKILENFMNTITSTFFKEPIFPNSMLSLDKHPSKLDVFYGYLYKYNENENLIKWYSKLKTEEPIDSKEGLSVLEYFNLFNSFNISNYRYSYLGYFEYDKADLESKRNFLDLILETQGGLESFICFYSKTLGLDLNSLIDKESLGRYMFSKYNLKNFTPKEMDRKFISLKMDPQYPHNSYEFIGDYEDWEEFDNLDVERLNFKNQIEENTLYIHIMKNPDLYIDKDVNKQLDNSKEKESTFYKGIADQFISRGIIYNKFLHLEKINLDSLFEKVLAMQNIRCINNFYFRDTF